VFSAGSSMGTPKTLHADSFWREHIFSDLGSGPWAKMGLDSVTSVTWSSGRLPLWLADPVGQAGEAAPPVSTPQVKAWLTRAQRRRVPVGERQSACGRFLQVGKALITSWRVGTAARDQGLLLVGADPRRAPRRCARRPRASSVGPPPGPGQPTQTWPPAASQRHQGRWFTPATENLWGRNANR